jgi:hypothetical protein
MFYFVQNNDALFKDIVKLLVVSSKPTLDK